MKRNGAKLNLSYLRHMNHHSLLKTKARWAGQSFTVLELIKSDRITREKIFERLGEKN
jgi:hypothetical protein